MMEICLVEWMGDRTVDSLDRRLVGGSVLQMVEPLGGQMENVKAEMKVVLQAE